jgi:hypothetical protein
VFNTTFSNIAANIGVMSEKCFIGGLITSNGFSIFEKVPGGSMTWVVGLTNNSYKSITNTAPGFINYKKGALDSQPQVIKVTSCLPMVGGSLRVLRLLQPLPLYFYVFRITASGFPFGIIKTFLKEKFDLI